MAQRSPFEPLLTVSRIQLFDFAAYCSGFHERLPLKSRSHCSLVFVVSFRPDSTSFDLLGPRLVACTVQLTALIEEEHCEGYLSHPSKLFISHALEVA